MVRNSKHLDQGPKLEDHNLLAVYNCLLNVFAATLQICKPFLLPQAEDAVVDWLYLVMLEEMKYVIALETERQLVITLVGKCRRFHLF
jgi:hypothetical protein